MSQACALVDRSLGAVDAELADFLAGKSLDARIFALPWILSLACAIPPTSEGKKNSSKKKQGGKKSMYASLACAIPPTSQRCIRKEEKKVVNKSKEGEKKVCMRRSPAPHSSHL